MKKSILFTGLLLLSLTAAGCGTSSSSAGSADDHQITINKDAKEVIMPSEVNGKYFTESTRHGVVYKGGSNGEKSVLRGLVDEKQFHDALVEIGAVAGENIKAADMEVGADDPGKSVDGDKLDVFVTWEGANGEIPFDDIINQSEERGMDVRFGGNLAAAESKNTGCILCLDSCAVGITSDASYPTGTSQHDKIQFYGNEEILPADGTQVDVIFRLAQ